LKNKKQEVALNHANYSSILIELAAPNLRTYGIFCLFGRFSYWNIYINFMMNVDDVKHVEFKGGCGCCTWQIIVVKHLRQAIGITSLAHFQEILKWIARIQIKSSAIIVKVCQLNFNMSYLILSMYPKHIIVEVVHYKNMEI
jgi:hypothetical protein